MRFLFKLLQGYLGETAPVLRTRLLDRRFVNYGIRRNRNSCRSCWGGWERQLCPVSGPPAERTWHRPRWWCLLNNSQHSGVHTILNRGVLQINYLFFNYIFTLMPNGLLERYPALFFSFQYLVDFSEAHFYEATLSLHTHTWIFSRLTIVSVAGK